MKKMTDESKKRLVEVSDLLTDVTISWYQLQMNDNPRLHSLYDPLMRDVTGIGEGMANLENQPTEESTLNAQKYTLYGAARVQYWVKHLMIAQVIDEEKGERMLDYINEIINILSKYR